MLTIKTSRFIAILLLVALSALQGTASCDVQAKWSQYSCPIYSGGYNLRFGDKTDGFNGMSYFANVDYPASEVISFYNEAFQNEGWVSTVDKLGIREWADVHAIDSGTLIRNKRYTMSWHDTDKSTYLLVVLTYYSGDGDEKLGVSCNSYPYDEILRIMELM